MDNIEGNKLIAEFMGWKENSMWKLPLLFPHHLIKEDGSKALYCGDDHLEFNESWDWLMPVVEKINKTIGSNPAAFLHLVMFSPELWCGRMLQTSTLKVWLACIEYIKWHNENKEKQ